MFTIYSIVRKIKPKIIVETGVAYGYPTTFILLALEKNNKGRLYSIDIDKNAGELVPNNLKHRWEFIAGTSEEKLPVLINNLPHIDLFIHDSLHTYENMISEFKTAWDKIVKNGFLMSHDIDHNTAFFDFARMVCREPYYMECWERQYGFNFGVLIK